MRRSTNCETATRTAPGTGMLRTMKTTHGKTRAGARSFNLDDVARPVLGKELTVWVEKLFEVKINPATITKRAQRTEEHDDRTNVLKKSNTAAESNTYQPINIEYSKHRLGLRGFWGLIGGRA